MGIILRSSLWLIAVTWFLFGCLGLPENSAPPPVYQTCTAMGCGFTLQIELFGNVPFKFILRAVGSNGETVSVHCREGVVVYDAQTTTAKSPICGDNQVAFMDFSPQDLTVSIESQAINVTQDLQPEYKVFRPNGPDCEPQCRSARIEFYLQGK